MASSVLIGIDVGTSSTKAIVLARDGQVLGLAAQDTPVDIPRPNWAEQDPEVWVTAALSTMRSAVASAGVDPATVEAIGIAGQMHGTVCVDSAGAPLRPAIIWADQRSAPQVTRVRRLLGDSRLAACTGNPVATGFMLPTWLWLLDHEPAPAAATRWLMLPKDYVRYRLTGEVGTEPSDAASTSLFDPIHRSWSGSLLSALGLDPTLLPCVHGSADIAGVLQPVVAESAGLISGIPVIYGGSDQAMQALGNGVLTPGVVSSTIGTGGQIFAPTAQPVIDVPGLRLHSYCHVLRDVWHVETAMLSAGLSLRWLRDQVMDGESYATLADAALSVPAGVDGLLFAPYLAGERTPHMDPRARASFVGLTRRHGRQHLVRAVMEGVVFGMRQGLEIMESLGVPVDTVVASGGAAQHPLWLQLQADIYGRPVRRTTTIEASAKGAAMLAGVGVGVYSSAEAAVARAVRWHEETVMPDPARVALYHRHYGTYCGLYPALRETSWALSDAGGHGNAEHGRG